MVAVYGKTAALQDDYVNVLWTAPIIILRIRVLVSKQLQRIIGFQSRTTYKIVWTDMEMQSRRILKPLKRNIENIHGLRCCFNVYMEEKIHSSLQ